MNDREVRDPQGRSEIHQAAGYGDAALAERLIAPGADVSAVDQAGMTPLHMACLQDHLEVARLLLVAGAPVDALDGHGDTPLWRAVFAFQGGSPDLVRLLLDAGADPDLKNFSDRSPRDMARTFDRPGIRTVLDW